MSTPELERTGSALAISPDQNDWTPEQRTAILQASNLAANTPPAQLAMFFHICQRVKLDPFRKQIYMIGRRSSEWNPETNSKTMVMKYTIQTGIDGFRATGERRAAERRVKLVKPTITLCGEDGEFKRVYVGPKDPDTGKRQPPVAALAVGEVDGETIEVVAYYDEFVQLVPEEIWRDRENGNGREKVKTGRDVPNSMWGKMPANQLMKCCEALWYRRAFSDDLTGIYTDDEINPNGRDVVNAQAEVIGEGPVQGNEDNSENYWARRIEQLGEVEDFVAAANQLWEEMVQRGAKTTARASAMQARVQELHAQRGTPETPDGAGEDADVAAGGQPSDEGATPAPDGDDDRPRYCMHGQRVIWEKGKQRWLVQCEACSDAEEIEWAEGDAPEADAS